MYHLLSLLSSSRGSCGTMWRTALYLSPTGKWPHENLDKKDKLPQLNSRQKMVSNFFVIAARLLNKLPRYISRGAAYIFYERTMFHPQEPHIIPSCIYHCYNSGIFYIIHRLY
jgi:hypothetical protein